MIDELPLHVFVNLQTVKSISQGVLLCLADLEQHFVAAVQTCVSSTSGPAADGPLSEKRS